MIDHGADGPLAGLRVLDTTTQLGRYAGKVLAELGADVVRVLPGERGPDVSGPDAPGLLDWWHDLNCRVVPLDLDDPTGVERFRSLVAECDVLVDAEPRPAMEPRGLDHEALIGLNPRLVHVVVSPQGIGGPRGGWRSSDLVAQALGGYLSVTGDPDRPVALWGRQAATIGGFYAAVSALAGLRRARVSGNGCLVDLSVHEALISCSEHLLMFWWFAEALAPLGAPIADRQRSLHWIRAFEVVPCKRGACMVSPAAGGLLGLIAWLKERGYATEVPDEPADGELLALVPAMMDALRAAALATDATELFEAGQSLHVPFGEAYSIPQVATCVQHESRGFLRPVAALPSGEEIRSPGPLARFAATPAPDPRPPSVAEGSGIDWSPADRDDDEAQDMGAPVPDGDARPLAGLRVLDLTHVLAGPFATRVLADLGADVIRVQTEERSAGASANDYPYNVMWARSKRSIQLHVKHPKATDVLRQLVEQADVVVDNFSAGVMDGWGAGPDQLRAWNPTVISLSMSGCGSDGPWQSYVTYAPTVHALCGFTALTGPAGETDCGPGMAYNDHVSGLAGAVALLSALAHRDRTGEGQHIEMSQFEVGTYLVGPALVDYLATGREARSAGNVDPFADYPLNDVFLGSDGDWVAITLFDDADVAMAAELGVVAAEEAGETSSTGLQAAAAAWVADRAAREVEAALQAAGLAAGVVQNAGHLVEDDAQLADRDWLVEMDSPLIGTQHTERHPARWFAGGQEIALEYRPSPYLGEHNFEVYEEVLGWDAVQIAEAIGDELIF